MSKGKGFIPREFIDMLIARADIVSVINQRVPLKRAGSNYKACCPFHDEKTPSFTVSEPKQFYYCFGCNASGSVLDFLMNYERLEFVEAIEALAQIEGLEVPYESRSKQSEAAIKRQKNLLEVMSMAEAFYRQQLRISSDKERAVNYLQKRGITGDDAKKFGIGFAPEGWNGLLTELTKHDIPENELLEAGLLSESDNHRRYDRFRDRIMFPIRNRKGDTIGFGGRILDQGEPKYLNSPETPIFKKGEEVYGLYELRKYCRDYNEIIVVEGYMDVVMLSHYGIGNSVATLGTAIGHRQIELLLRYTSRIVFCFDGDRAGRGAAHKAMDESFSVLTAGKEVSFLFLPEGEDPDSYVQAHGKEAFQNLVKNAAPLSQFLFEAAESDVNMNSFEGRSQFLEIAGEKINSMRDIPLRDFLRAELGRRANLAESLLNRYVKEGRSTTSRRKVNFSSGQSLVERILILLLSKPALARDLQGLHFLLESEDRQQNLLYEVIAAIKDYQNLATAAQLIRHFEEEPWGQWLRNLAMQELIIDEELQEGELKDLMQQLAKGESPLKKVLAKLQNNEPLTEDELMLLRHS
ncbi:DNA primase [Ignatzschineria rhizosphaerae]|uniref:DNA primase n=1 Tax=Ignatzschineria rhizosphaerae TaxID=2923279 RepID=A0ABY3WWQ0_9GAMM|nr:DNA primase [Ignatzschineria rhizosphaerae]UNM95036.1 DNA primase [Ignatzschineria rhizosphaerae]